MRIATVLLCALPLMAAEPAGYKYWSASELKGMEKTLAGKLAGKSFASDRIGDYGNHYALMAHREGNGEAELHENEADLFVVESGAATLTIGGKVVNPKTTAPGEIRGPSIEGGATQKLGPGDIVHIPSKTAHQLTLNGSKQFNYFVMKVKD
jgi:mannose-6-phosphate isomerase-like protein (cupin superfamily)